MIKIAIWYSSDLGRNDGNPLYVTGFLKRAQFYADQILQRNRNDSLLAYFPHYKGKLKDDPQAKEFAAWFLDTFGEPYQLHHLRPHKYEGEYGEFDLNFWIDWGEDGLTGVLGYEPEWPKGKVVYWASDTHLGYDYRLKCAKRSDLVFCAQRKAAESFSKEGVYTMWLPHCYDPMAYPKFELASKRYDVSFVGHINSENRIDALDRLFKEFPNFYFGQKRFEDCSRVYAESKIVFNIAMKDDLNMRVFEALGSGSFLLTDNISTLSCLFESTKHLVAYDSINDAIYKARYYLNHDDERERIAWNGYQEVLHNHTIKDRVTKVFEVIKNTNLLKEPVHAPILQ